MQRQAAGTATAAETATGSRHKYIIGNNRGGGGRFWGWAGRKVLAAASSCTLDDALLLFLITYRQCAPATLSHKSICPIHRYTHKTCMRLHAMPASVFVVRARLLIALAFKLDTSTVLHMTSLSERCCWHLRLSEGHFAIHYSVAQSACFWTFRSLCTLAHCVCLECLRLGKGSVDCTLHSFLYILFSIVCLSLRDVGRQMSRSCRQRFDLARQAMPLVRFTSVERGERCLRHISYGTDTISGENHLRCINQNTNLEKHLFSGIFDLVQSHERNQKSVENS